MANESLPQITETTTLSDDDEYLLNQNGNPRRIKAKNAAKYTSPVAIYVDSEDGSDSNDGVTPSTPKQTLSSVVTLAESLDSPGRILLSRGGHWYNEHPDYTNLDYWSFGAWKQGNRPIIDGAQAVSGTWTQHGTHTNLWYIDVTFSESTSGDYATTKSSAWHPALWDQSNTDRNDDAYVTRCLADDMVGGSTLAPSSIDDLLTVANASAGRFTVHRTGSTAHEPRNTAENSTQFRFYLHPRDGADPNSSGRTVYVVDQRGLATLPSGVRMEDISFQRTGGKNMIGLNGGATKPEAFWRCEFIDVAVHAIVAGGVECRNCFAKAALHGDSKNFITDLGGAFHQFRSTSSEGQSDGFKIFDCEAEGFGLPVYSHGAGGVDPTEHDTFDIDGLITRNCYAAIGRIGATRKGASIRRVRATGAQTALNALSSGVVVEDSRIQLDSGSVVQVFEESALITFRRSYVYGNASLLMDPNSIGSVASSAYPKLTLEDSTMFGDFDDPGNTNREQQHITLVNSILGTFDADWISGDFVTDATSAIMFDNYTREDLAASHAGVHADTLTGARRQVFEKTVLLSDLTFATSTRTASFTDATGNNGDGTADIILSNNDRNYGRYIRVVDAYGSGLHYEGRIVDPGAGSGDPVICTPVPTADFAAKAMDRSMFGIWIYRDAVTANLSEDGFDLGVPDGDLFNAGMVINVSHPFTGEAYGNRTITSISSNTLTLDEACPWQIGINNTVFKNVSGGGSGRDLPTVQITFGFVTNKRNSALMTRPFYAVTPVEGGADFIGLQSSDSTADFASSDDIRVDRDPDGGWNGSDPYKGFAHEAGYFETGLTTAVGDVLKLETDILVPGDRADLLNDYTKTDHYHPDWTKLPFRRGAGYPGDMNR